MNANPKNNMKKLLRSSFVAILAGGLFVSSAVANNWSFSYMATSDGSYKTDQVYVSAACSVSVVVHAIPGPGVWTEFVDPVSEMSTWTFSPGWAFAEAAVVGPEYSYHEIQNAGGGSDYLDVSGNTTAGTYTAYAVGQVSEGGQALVNVSISW